MIINVTNEDILTEDPIKVAVKREYNIDVIVDSRFLIFKNNQGRPRRLPVSAESFEMARNLGKEVKPFSFEINASV